MKVQQTQIQWDGKFINRDLEKEKELMLKIEEKELMLKMKKKRKSWC